MVRDILTAVLLAGALASGGCLFTSTQQQDRVSECLKKCDSAPGAPDHMRGLNETRNDCERRCHLVK